MTLCKIEPRGNGWLSGVWGSLEHVDSSSVGGYKISKSYSAWYVSQLLVGFGFNLLMKKVMDNGGAEIRWQIKTIREKVSNDDH